MKNKIQIKSIWLKIIREEAEEFNRGKKSNILIWEAKANYGSDIQHQKMQVKKQPRNNQKIR